MYIVTVIRNGVEVDIKCQDILQGDLVRSLRDCDVPCDIVLLKSSDPNGKCHITTANLDGETNLKTLMVPKGLPKVPVGMQMIRKLLCDVEKILIEINYNSPRQTAHFRRD